MTVESGIAMVVIIDDGTPSAQTISNKCSDLTFSTPKAVFDITGIGEVAMHRLLGLGDFSMTLNGFFDDGSNLAHAVFKTVVSQAATIIRTISVANSGQTLTAETYATDYGWNRGADGSLTWSVPFVNQNGLAPVWS